MYNWHYCSDKTKIHLKTEAKDQPCKGREVVRTDRD